MFYQMVLYIMHDIEVWMVGVCQFLHANQDTQVSIEAYHGTIKRWLKHDTRRTKAQSVDWLVWRLTNPTSTHYFHVQETKRKGFIQNHNAKTIVEDGILQARTITFDI
jgi:hypothetical protein